MLQDPKWDKKLEVDAVGQHLLRAAACIEEQGWCQWRLMNFDGRVCLMGALAATLDTKSPRMALKHRDKNDPLIKAWRRVKDIIHMEPAEWNDTPGRTKDQVIQLLKLAAYDSQ